jgi:hypothetical protein
MAMRAKHWKQASLFGWLACGAGVIAICTKIVSYYVLWSVGETAATEVFVVRIFDADILAFAVGIPLGIFAWRLGRRDLGVLALALCGASLAATIWRIK